MTDRWETWKSFAPRDTQVTEAIEPFRRDKVIGSSLQAEVTARTHPDDDPQLLAELFIVSFSREAARSSSVTKTTAANAAAAGGICRKSPRTAAFARAARRW